MALTPEQEALDYNPELQGLSRERKLAELLMAKGMQQPQGQMISGYYVAPSWSQQLNPMANVLAGEAISGRADTKQTELAAALRTQKGEALSQFQKLMSNPETRTQAMQFASKNQFLQPLVADMMKPQNLAEGAKLVMPNIGGGEPINLAVGGEKKTEAIRGYELAKTQGYPGTFFEYEHQLKRAGAPNVINQVGASLAGQTGDLFKESKATAVVGYNAITSADKILNSTNKAITGPLANARLTGLQLADTLGVTGKGEKEKLAATREVLQETGKLALSAPPKGQGQVSNYERDLYQRAASGDINFTPTELNLIAKRAKDFGEYQIRQHNDLLKTGAELGPDVAKMARMYQVTPPPSVAQPAQTSNVRSAADAILQGK
jgi:hypothetical protein